MNNIQVLNFISIIEVVLIVGAILATGNLPDILTLLAGLVQLLTEIINLNILPSVLHLCVFSLSIIVPTDFLCQNFRCNKKISYEAVFVRWGKIKSEATCDGLCVALALFLFCEE